MLLTFSNYLVICSYMKNIIRLLSHPAALITIFVIDLLLIAALCHYFHASTPVQIAAFVVYLFAAALFLRKYKMMY